MEHARCLRSGEISGISVSIKCVIIYINIMCESHHFDSAICITVIEHVVMNSYIMMRRISMIANCRMCATIEITISDFYILVNGIITLTEITAAYSGVKLNIFRRCSAKETTVSYKYIV